MDGRAGARIQLRYGGSSQDSFDAGEAIHAKQTSQGARHREATNMTKRLRTLPASHPLFQFSLCQFPLSSSKGYSTTNCVDRIHGDLPNVRRKGCERSIPLP